RTTGYGLAGKRLVLFLLLLLRLMSWPCARLSLDVPELTLLVAGGVELRAVRAAVCGAFAMIVPCAEAAIDQRLASYATMAPARRRVERSETRRWTPAPALGFAAAQRILRGTIRILRGVFRG